MRTFLAFVAGFAAGIAIYRPASDAIVHYSEHSLPKEYVAPKYEIGGRRVTKEEFNAWIP